jgi:NADPH:quinone reductase-like Zn-dependent oxidoreductase
MSALELSVYGAPLRLVEKPVRRPGPGQVVVRIAASPVNPSDLMFLRGLYGTRKPLPVVPGFEGSGTVVAAGPGLFPRLLLGRRVSVAADAGDGTWAEYMLSPAARCLPLIKSVSLEQGAMQMVNPWTAWVLLDLARRGGHRAIAHAPAASALGQMMARLQRRFGLTILHIVRREDQSELLRGLGAEHILNSSDPDFDVQLRERAHRLGVRLAYDAVAGEMTGRLLEALPRHGRVVVYGAIAAEPSRLNPGNLIFRDQRVEGFWLAGWAAHRNPLQLLRLSLLVQPLLGSDLQTTVQARVPLAQAPAAIEQYAANMTQGKVLIVP